MSEERSVYKPSREGARAIALSFTGRHLLQSLREEVVDYAAKRAQEARAGIVGSPLNAWQGLSRVRERIAQYMSDLEKDRAQVQELKQLLKAQEDSYRNAVAVQNALRRELDRERMNQQVRIINIVEPFAPLAPGRYACTMEFKTEQNFGGFPNRPINPFARPKLNYIVRPKSPRHSTLHIQAVDWKAAQEAARTEYLEQGLDLTEVDFELYVKVAA